MLALEWGGNSLLIDCGGDVFQRFLAAGLDASGLRGLIITHEHPDHIVGLPLLMVRLWLNGRSEPFPVYGPKPALDQARRLMAAFDTSTWSLPEIVWREAALDEGAIVLQNECWTITGAPGVHGVPVLGLRMEHEDGFVVAYSSDTEPCPAISRLVDGCDLLVHEATGDLRGHSSAAQAAETARRAGASHLVLVHLSRGFGSDDVAGLSGPELEVLIGEELDRFEF